MPPPQPVLQAEGLTKHYGQVHALEGADFTAYPGEVVALIGDNGAGKSTLVKLLAGAHDPSSGEILVEGAARVLSPPAEAQRLGIETVYQDLSLIGSFTAAENFFLGRELAWGAGPRWLARCP